MDKRQLFRNIASGDRARRRMEKTGVTPNGHPLWTRPEKGTLADTYPDYDGALVEIKRRTRPAAHSKASRMRITKPAARRWDDNELLRLRRVYPRGSVAEILAAYPDRTWGAIRAKARGRGIHRQSVPSSTGIDLNDQILARAQELGLTLTDLDAFTRRRGYFAKGALKRALEPTALLAVVQALGGTLHMRRGVTDERSRVDRLGGQLPPHPSD